MDSLKKHCRLWEKSQASSSKEKSVHVYTHTHISRSAVDENIFFSGNINVKYITTLILMSRKRKRSLSKPLKMVPISIKHREPVFSAQAVVHSWFLVCYRGFLVGESLYRVVKQREKGMLRSQREDCEHDLLWREQWWLGELSLLQRFSADSCNEAELSPVTPAHPHGCWSQRVFSAVLVSWGAPSCW